MNDNWIMDKDIYKAIPQDVKVGDKLIAINRGYGTWSIMGVYKIVKVNKTTVKLGDGRLIYYSDDSNNGYRRGDHNFRVKYHPYCQEIYDDIDRMARERNLNKVVNDLNVLIVKYGLDMVKEGMERNIKMIDAMSGKLK